MVKKYHNRYMILASAVVVALMVGSTFCWSIFRNPLMDLHGWTATQVTLAYTLLQVFNGVGTFIYGPVIRRVQPRTLIMIAGTMQGLGYFLTGVANSIGMLYVGFALVAGLGNGVLYSAAAQTATRWFPDKKGLANGICIGAMGLSPVIFGPISNALISSFGVQGAWKVMGIIVLVGIWATAWLIVAPDDNWLPAGWNPDKIKSVNSSKREYTWKEMLRTPLFWSTWAMTVCSVASGLMMTSNSAAIAEHMMEITAAQSSMMVVIFAIGSFAGRFFFGFLSDKIGRLNVQLIVLAINAVDMLFFIGRCSTFTQFVIAMLFTGVCYGGVMSVLPAMVSDMFGPKNFQLNYAFVYTGFVIAGLIGPLAASTAYQSTGGYDAAFLVGGCVAVLGIVLRFITNALYKKAQKEADRT